MKKPGILISLCLLATTAIVFASTAPVFQLRLVLDAPSSDSEPMSYVTHNQYNSSSSTNVLNVQKTVLLDQTALKSAKADKDPMGHAIIDLKFTDSGAKQFAQVTKDNLRKRLAIIIDGQLCQAPIIQTEISGGAAQISGSFSKQEAKDLAKKINDALARK